MKCDEVQFIGDLTTVMSLQAANSAFKNRDVRRHLSAAVRSKRDLLSSAGHRFFLWITSP
jgi:hypothetical protein